MQKFQDVAVERAVAILQDKKVSDVVVLSLEEVNAFTDYFLIGSVQNSRQMEAAADALIDAFPETLHHREGYDESGWTLLDLGDVVIHLFTPEMRQYYDLERLWGDVKQYQMVP